MQLIRFFTNAEVNAAKRRLPFKETTQPAKRCSAFLVNNKVN